MGTNERGRWSLIVPLALASSLFVSGLFEPAAAGSGLKTVRGSADGMPQTRPTKGVSAILVDPYSGCSVQYGLATLNTDWSLYGATPLSITTGGALCAGQFTLRDLESSGADTVVLDALASSSTLTPDELDALQQYLNEGHTLVGLGDDFLWHKHVDNAIAPLFGLLEQSEWHSTGSDKGAPPNYTLQFNDPAAPILFRNLPNPYDSAAAGFDEKPTDKRWSKNEMAGASILGFNPTRRVAITFFDGGGYNAIYVANDVDYQSSTADLQFLYNALTYPSGS